MSLFGSEPKKAPVGLPSPDGGTVELVRGARIVRRVIYRGEAAAGLKPIVDRVAVAKSLGFAMFEMDVTPVKVRDAQDDPGAVKADSIYRIYFGSAPAPVEGDEWKQDEKARSKYVDSHVVTVYALVVE